jgi:hypothetical protein
MQNPIAAILLWERLPSRDYRGQADFAIVAYGYDG